MPPEAGPCFVKTVADDGWQAQQISEYQKFGESSGTQRDLRVLDIIEVRHNIAILKADMGQSSPSARDIGKANSLICVHCEAHSLCFKVKEFISNGHISTCAEHLVLRLYQCTPLCPVVHRGLVMARHTHTVTLQLMHHGPYLKYTLQHTPSENVQGVEQLKPSSSGLYEPRSLLVLISL